MSFKSIYIVLIHSSTVPSRLIGFFTRDKYTHASISLDKELRQMYSFSRRWATNPFIGCFKREVIEDALHNNRVAIPSVVLELSVTEEQYMMVITQIEAFVKERNRYGYNYIGLLANFFRLKYKNDARFFCSEFVYHILYESGILDLRIHRGFVSPQDLLKVGNKIVYEGDFRKYTKTLSFV